MAIVTREVEATRRAFEELIKFIKAQHAAGASREETKGHIREEFCSLGGDYGLDMALAIPGVDNVYDELDFAEKERTKVASKEAQGVALYDALTALGWKPPE